MNRYFITTLLLIILNVSLCLYLRDLLLAKKTYEFINDHYPLIYQKKDIVLNDIEDFVFDDYFTILDFNDSSYTYRFLDDELLIKIKDNNLEFKFPYSIIEPQIIEKEVIKYETIYVENNSNNNQTAPNNDVIIEEVNDTKIYYLQSHYSFNVGTDISTIISIISSDITCYDNVTVDYAYLNPYEVGVYSVYFYSSSDKVIKTIEIV